WDHFALALRPKILGAWNLHVLTQEQNLDFFVLYSSVAGVLGSVGQGNHAAANAFLDALAHYRRTQGLPGLSIDWGAWNQIGAAAQEQVQERVRRQGLGMLEPAQGSQALETLLPLSLPQVIVLPISQSWQQGYQFASENPLLADLIQPGTIQEQRKEPLLSRNELLQLASTERQQWLENYLRRQIARVLRFSTPAQLEVNQPLNSLGIDSLMAIELKNRIQTDIGVDIPITSLLQGPSIAQFATQLLELLAADDLFSPLQEKPKQIATDDWEVIEL
ncbi:MAG TPA: beta-ketoacyl reductase, partial [Ktedonobacteraceae bacterium]|nr:beta-ketoacyl reductase [Ktedonobacteraceae bacterium]